MDPGSRRSHVGSTREAEICRFMETERQFESSLAEHHYSQAIVVPDRCV